MNEEHRTLRGVCMEHERLDEGCFLGCVLDGGTFKEKRRMYTAMRHARSGGTGSNLKQTVVQYTRE